VLLTFLCTMRTLFGIAAFATVYCAAARNIKVLSYSGPGAGIDDIDNQHLCFEQDIIPGVTIRGTKKPSIRAGDLDGYDVLLMPGGDPDPEVQNCDREEVLGFMRRGGGYYGTCAGAMAACTWKSVDPVTGQFNPYNLSQTAEPEGHDADGKPIFPKYVQFATFGLTEAVCHSFYGVGVQHNTLTPEGQKAFPNQNLEVDIDHHNGPSFTTENAGIRLANYRGGEMDGYASIVGDTYQGTGGKVIIVSPHPEHTYLQNCDIVTYMAAYAAGLDVSEYITV